jgi:hypothetical protein
MAMPEASAAMYGLPAEDATALAFVRAMGARDLALGGSLIANRDDARALAGIFFWSTLVALTDAALVAGLRGLRPQLALHLAGAVALAVAGNVVRDAD